MVDQILEEKQEIDSVLSETLNLTDSDAELEKELAELSNKDNVDISNTIFETNPEIKKLEQRLKDLHMEGKYCVIYYHILYKLMEYL